MTYDFLSPPDRFKPKEFKEFTHILTSTTVMFDRAYYSFRVSVPLQNPKVRAKTSHHTSQFDYVTI